ncbi:MAG: hypothetical protein JOS17DRAFT_730342 [Linnemannia elongata]|nr:MAG: hypothetical protein JOS17DRAFT_730342 [Linnemannia elongata]
MEAATAAQDLYRAFRIAESAWIHSQEGLTSTSTQLEDCSLHYGEFAFLLAGLKPCLLLQLPTPAMTTAFFHNVLVPQVMRHPAYKTLSTGTSQTTLEGQGLECRLITRDVRSPEMSLQGYVLLWSSTTVESHPQAASIQRSIDLLCPTTTGETKPVMISEQDLAAILDIPGRLPANEAEIRAMVEVSYWHQDESAVDSSPTLLTAFAAQPDQIPAIQTHFKQYRDSVRGLFDMNLKLHVQAMADP